jgi:hypothetical protein
MAAGKLVLRKTTSRPEELSRLPVRPRPGEHDLVHHADPAAGPGFPGGGIHARSAAAAAGPGAPGSKNA